jgi:hypothetical protein
MRTILAKKIALTGPTTTVQQGGIGAMGICTLNGLHVVKPLMQLRTLGCLPAGTVTAMKKLIPAFVGQLFIPPVCVMSVGRIHLEFREK